MVRRFEESLFNGEHGAITEYDYYNKYLHPLVRLTLGNMLSVINTIFGHGLRKIDSIFVDILEETVIRLSDVKIEATPTPEEDFKRDYPELAL